MALSDQLSTFFAGVLAAIGAPNTQANQQSLQKWSNYEIGAGTSIAGRWNPLNTTTPEPGATNFNSVGVKNFATEASGEAATAATLENGRYPTIVGELQSGAGLSAPAAANVSTWGTHGFANVLSETPSGAAGGTLANSGPLGQAGVAPAAVQTATTGFDWNPIDWPGQVLGLVGNTAGSILGGAAGSAAGSFTTGALSGIVTFGSSFGNATLFPWFKRNSVPLIAGVIIWAILTHKTDAAPTFNFDVPVFSGGSGSESKGPKEETGEVGAGDEVGDAAAIAA